MANVKKQLLRAVTEHPVATAGVVGGAALGIALVSKAVNTAAKVVTLKAAANAATEVAHAVTRSSGKKKAATKKSK